MPETALAVPQDVAAIDIGSNSVRLVLYRLEGRALWTVFNEKVLAGLGRDLESTGRLSVEGVEQAVTALRRFAAVIEGVKPAHAFVAATAAVRDAEDGPDFCARVEAETGLKVRVLSGEEEARYSARGVLAGNPAADGVAADLGGSSLELTRIENSEPIDGVTLPLGPFAFSGPELDPVDRAEAILKRLKGTGRFKADTLYAVGGAWRTFAQVHMGLERYPLHIVHQYRLPAAAVRQTARLVSRQSRASLEKWPGLSKRRADTLPHAALVLDALLDKLELKHVVWSAWGVREGLVHGAFSRTDAATDPLLAGLSALGARQGVSPGLPEALIAWTAPIVAALPSAFEDGRDAILAQAACRLADIGARLHPDHRVELAFDQVLRAPVPGQTHAERAWLATAVNARYGGGPSTPEPETVERLLDENQQRAARAFGVAIRLACDLSGRSPAILASTAATVADGTLTLTAKPGHDAVLLGEQTRKRAKALAEAMELTLDIQA